MAATKWFNVSWDLSALALCSGRSTKNLYADKQSERGLSRGDVPMICPGGGRVRCTGEADPALHYPRTLQVPVVRAAYGSCDGHQARF